jgi:Domain of unknown function (DUF4386)
VLDADHLHYLMMLLLKLHGQGIFVVQIFWGLWLFPFALLVIRSGFIPKILGVLLISACFGYLTSSFTFLLFPRYGDMVSSFATMPSGIGELSIMLWFLIKGVKDQQPVVIQKVN